MQPSFSKQNDEDLVGKIRSLLEVRLGLLVNDISITVDRGSITLYGSVDTPEQIEVAVTITRGTPGVSSVTNYISLKECE